MAVAATTGRASAAMQRKDPYAAGFTTMSLIAAPASSGNALEAGTGALLVLDLVLDLVLELVLQVDLEMRLRSLTSF